MSNKREIRRNFRDKTFERDGSCCKWCGQDYSDSEFPESLLDAHHITDRKEMPNGGYVPEDIQYEWKKQLTYYGLDEAELIVSQSKSISEEHLSVEFIEDMYKDKDIQIHEKDDKIKFLESQLAKNKPKKTINLLEIEKEIQINYNKVQKLSYNESMELNFNGKVDTIPTFMVKWEPGYKDAEEDSKRLVQWLELRLKVDSPRIVNY